MAPAFDVKASSFAQQLLCEKNKLKMVAPKTGVCDKCGLNIFTLYPSLPFGYSVQLAGTQRITKCPYCSYNYEM